VTAPVSDSPATIDDLLLDDPHGEEATAAQSLNKQPFCWEKQWYAVAVASAMDATRPNPIQLLGKNLVVWMDGTGQWQCFEDRCPHRAAPLSEGKIWSDGTLMCSYHGWRFDDQGNCVRIPQAASPEAEQRACSSSRACATKYPIAQAQGMLFVWGEGGKDAEKESSKAPLPVCEHLKAAEERGEEVHYLMRHYVRDLPYDFQTLVENVVDPAHVPFSHHGYQGNRDKVKYGDYELKAVSDSARDRLAVEYEGIMGKSNLSFLPPARVNFFRTPKVSLRFAYQNFPRSFT
jgi:phenylpropionate dioxygenase-like ring-hydroxylating dioxygenase large terminal subunit